mmetsp:Transcript_88719/g.153546  ORF Transcript_88719/g.153546 Transcript_88719/m.153546 type:complete len:1496 (+) Transcript_88719:65-4552(+)
MLSSRMSAARHSVSRDDSWPGREPNSQDRARFEKAMKHHKEIHTLEDATYSVQEVCNILKEFDSKDVIPNRNAMQICLQHCFLKSASFCAETVCFDAASVALQMMEKQRCRFDLSAVVQIVLAISLRADLVNITALVRQLVKGTLTHLSDNERSFVSRHIIFALAERKAAVEESLHRPETFHEGGLRMDWEKSSAQEFHLYNATDGGRKLYRPVEGYGFSKKGLVALLSMEPDSSGQQHYEYKLKRDGAIVDVIKANEDEPLVVRMRTPVTVPFKEHATYRLDNMDIDELQAKRIMESLRVFGRDPHPNCARLVPHPYLCQSLHLPPEEPYAARIVLQPKIAPLDGELDVNEYGNEPIRVRSIGTGAFLQWNLKNPNNAIHVGDRIVKVNEAVDKESILEEFHHAHQWSKYELKMTFMKKVKARDHDMPDELLPNAKDTSRVLNERLSEPTDVLNEKLNPSQVEALRAASTRRLSLIQGPPGTGKTTTAVELLDFLLEHDVVPTPILVSGHTNAAVDNILAGLIHKGRSVVRIGEESKVRLECQPYLLGEAKAAEPSKAEVICATCSGSGSGTFHKEGIKCHTVLIDEASQATESSCLIPLCHAAQHLVLVGDQCQLEPFVKSEFTKIEDLGKSLFNRFCQQGITPTMLNTQYRMHPSICEFPSEAFYNGQLLSGVGHGKRMPTSYWQWPSRRNPVCFIDAKDGMEASSEGQIEKKNELEVNLVLSALKELMRDPELRTACEDGTYPVGIITPYAAQREAIIKELVREGFVDAKGKLLVEANSVDGFQGREKDIIIFSAVRANSEGSVGFLHDWRRINVMLTRSKRGLIVIGHRETLQTDFYWSNWLKWVAMRGCIMDEPACGNWLPRCLVEDEWVMKPESNQAPKHEETVIAVGEHDVVLSVDDKQESSYDMWESFYTASEGSAAIDLECSEASFCTDSAMSCEITESWEDLVEAKACGPLDKMLLQMQDADTSEGSCCTPSAMSIELADTWEDLVEANTCSPLDKMTWRMQDADSSTNLEASSSWEDLKKASTCGPLDRMIQQSQHGTGIGSGVDLPITLPTQVEQDGKATLPAEIPSVQIVDVPGMDGRRGSQEELSSTFLSDDHAEASHADQVHHCAISMDVRSSSPSGEAQELPQEGAREQAPEALSLERHKTADWFEYPEAHSQWCGFESAPTGAAWHLPQDHASQVVTVWMPMVVPLSNFEAGDPHVPGLAPIATQEPSNLLSSQTQESSSWPEVPAEPAHYPLSQPQPQENHEKHSQNILPQPQSIDVSLDETSNAYNIVWHADAKKLWGNDRCLVSPDVELSLAEHDKKIAFKLMILPDGRGFAKSQGRGSVQLKCGSDVGTTQTVLNLSLTIGNRQIGLVSHDFSSHPLATLHQQVLSLRREEDPLSKTLRVSLRVAESCKSQPTLDDPQAVETVQSSIQSLASSGCSRSMADHVVQPAENVSGVRGRRRSEAGRQHQRERWLSRRQHYANRNCSAAASGSATSC